MPLNLNKDHIELLWLIQPNLQDQQLEIKKKFEKPIVSMEVNDVMYITISSDYDYIYKLNPFSSAYRGNTTFFVFKVNSSTQTIQDYLVLKLNDEVESSVLDSFMCHLMDYTDLLDLESASFKNETLKKIFQQFKRKETCTFNKDDSNKQDVLNSLNFHHQVYVDKEKADMITNGGQVVGDGIVSLAKMASNLIETIGTQIATNCEQKLSEQKNSNESMSTESSSESSESDSNEEKSSSKKGHSKRHRRHRHSRKHKKGDNDEEEDSSSNRHSTRRHRRRARRAANLKRLNEFTRSFSQTAQIAASAISSAIAGTASYVVPAVEEYLPGVISSVTNYDEEASRKLVGSGLGYGSVALNAMGNIKNGVAEGVGIIGSSFTTQTTQVVKSK